MQSRIGAATLKNAKANKSFANPPGNSTSPNSLAVGPSGAVPSGATSMTTSNVVCIDDDDEALPRQLAMMRMLKPPAEKKTLEDRCHRAWALFFYKYNIPFVRAFEAIGSEEFHCELLTCGSILLFCGSMHKVFRSIVKFCGSIHKF